MKLIHLIPIPLIALAIGSLRQAELHRLSKETTRLLAHQPAREFRASDREPARPPLSQNKRKDILEIGSEIHRIGEQARTATKDLRARLRSELSALDRSQVKSLIEESVAGLDMAERAKRIDPFVKAFTEAKPKEALLLILEIPDYSPRDQALYSAFERSAKMDPFFAIRVSDQLAGENRQELQHSMMQSVLLGAKARAEPHALISQLLSSQGNHLMATLPGLATKIVREPGTAEEHRALLAATRSEANRFPDSKNLQELRNRHVDHLRRTMMGWPYEDAVSLVEGEFTPQEKTELIFFLNESDQPEQWVDWLAKIQWTESREHPIGGFIRNWMETDPAKAGTWLEKQPDGPIRNTAAKNYAMQLASKDPRAAANAAMMLPQGRDRSHAMAVIRDEWKKKDAAAYSAFADKNGLKK